ncbi:hypothetical protein V2J09_018744 [Rumex salicifolius]
MDASKNQSLPISRDASDDDGRQKRMTRKGLYAAASYMICAVLLIIFNKAALSSYRFPHVNVITLFQMICSCLLLYIMRRAKIITFIAGETASDRPVTLVPIRKMMHTLPLALSYLLYMLVSMESVRGINVPMYTTLRRTTVVITMAVEFLLTGQKYSRYIVASVAVIIVGAFVAGARDLSFDAYSYSIVLLSNLCTAVYLASIARIGKSSGLNSFGLMWCNGVLCGPVLLMWTCIKGDLEKLINFPYLMYPGFQAVMLLSCIMAFLLNYTLNVFGQLLGFMGSGLYAYCRLKGK